VSDSLESFSSGFVILGDKEAVYRFRRLIRNSIKLLFWKKGRTERLWAKATGFDENKRLLEIEWEGPGGPHLKPDLASFEVSGLSCYLKVRWERITEVKSACYIVDKIYKYERRKFFRLNTYPHFDLFLTFPYFTEKTKDNGVVVDIRTRKSDQELFKSFMEMMGDTDDRPRFRVMDLSISGLSIVVGKLYESYFLAGKTFKNIELNVLGEVIEFAKIEVVYKRLRQKSIQGALSYQVGMRIPGLSENKEYALSTKIQELLRGGSAHHDFEKLID